ncbi:aminotransferase class IV [Flectobacillus sp. DC10W]|uniref:branched-chain-amino-acid transaminase n=1 Tax=Flectobacillus longus TaxID=2984207 RepID=A0ABT6YM24_9BACT|nr:aminotransferase class IV [Flectobacillus longus]MDI9864504.1 aminotransferase class IV [Flectobacillus longus]
MQEFIYLNDAFVKAEDAKIHVSDLALVRGYGIFDFFRAIDGKAIFLEDHLDRFENSARLMGLPIPATRDQLRAIILESIQRHPLPLLGIKMILTGGFSADGYLPAETSNLIVTAKPFEFKNPDKGMKLLSLEYKREIPEIKTLNYIVPIRIQPQLRAQQADDVLYHQNGIISESSRSNIFIVKDNIIATPKDGALFGVTRKHIIKLASRFYTVEERDVSFKEYLQADEVFTTGSTKRIVPIAQTDEIVFNNGQTGPVTKHLQELFLAYEKQNG